jgi:hypothetical protein
MVAVRRLGALWGACLLALAAFPLTAGAAPVRNPENGHFYEAVRRSAGVSWNTANEAAGERAHDGMRGHLATVTSPAENRFIVRTFPEVLNGRYFLGGFQLRGIRDPMAGWQWVTGEPWSYTYWNRLDGGEPNDYYGLGTGSLDENKLQYFENTDGRWNDVRPAITNESVGYVVEYEPDPPAAAPTVTGYTADQPQDTAVTSAPPGTLLRLTGTNLGREGTVLFEGIVFPAAVASWSPTEVRLWVPTAPSYPFDTHLTVITDRQRAEGTALTIPAPAIERDNLLANASFEFPDSRTSDSDWGYTYGESLPTNAPTFNGYSIPGWRIPFGTIDVVRFLWQNAPGQGRQSIDLVGTPYAGTIEQSFYTESGRQYILSGWLAKYPGIPEARINVYLNGGTPYFLSFAGYTLFDDMGWDRFSIPFRANASQTTVSIQDVTGRNHYQGMALDGVIVTLARS